MIYGYYAIVKKTGDSWFGYCSEFDFEPVYGENYIEVIKKIRDKLSEAIMLFKENQTPYPESLEADQIKTTAGESLAYIEIDIDVLVIKMQNQYVKKNLTIPRYLNELGVQNKINFSKLLTETLENKFGIGGRYL